MITLNRRNDIVRRSMEKLPCSQCLHDAAFSSGMTGGARCPLIERANIETAIQAEWRYDGEGGWTCKSFASCTVSPEAGRDKDKWVAEVVIPDSAQ